jgi:hypothetical protein
MAIWSILLPFGMYILWPLEKFYGYLVYCSVLECFTKKNLATLILSPFRDQIAPYKTFYYGGVRTDPEVDAMATNAANANNKTPYYVIQLKVCL